MPVKACRNVSQSDFQMAHRASAARAGWFDPEWLNPEWLKPEWYLPGAARI